MAEFLDSGTPGFVYAQTPTGPMLVDRSVVGPQDTIRPAATPAPAAPVAPMAPAPAAAQPATAASVLQKVNTVLGPLQAARQPTLELAGTSTTTSTQKGIAPEVLNPILERNTARGEEQAAAVKQAGEERATRREQAAMTETGAAYGRQQVAEADRAQAEQRAQIARQNELALTVQTDPEIQPDRFVRSMSTGQSILTTVLAAINGAFKGMVGQQGNDVMDILGKRIDADLQAQREQIQSGRVRRGNLIAYFQNAGLREEAAEKAAEATSWAMVDRMVAAEKERIAAGEDRTSADLLGEQLKSQTAAKNDELALTLGQDRVSTQTTRTMQQKAAPGGAPGTLAKVAEDMKGARDIEQMQKSGLTQAEYDKQKNEYSDKTLKNDDLVSRAREVAQSLGGDVEEVKDAKGRVTAYRVTGDFDTPHFGDEATRYESAISNLQRADVMGMAREPSAKLQDAFSAATEMPFLDEQKKARIQQILNMALRERANLRAGYNSVVTYAVDSTKDTGNIPYPEAGQ